MAQDVFSKMADDPCLLKEDGYLHADTDLKKIVYHPTLNVILICTNSGIVRVLDVNSGVVLQSTCLSAQNQKDINCHYIPGQDRILFCDGQSLGVRSDYNGVLLLDTILQKSVASVREDVKLELLLSEAVILKQCLSNINTTSVSVNYVVNELTSKIQEAQKQCKKGIKAQKWNTVCLDLPLELLRTASTNIMTELMMKNQHSPEIGVASAIEERLSELLGEPVHAADRRAMASEAKRRETFAHWPHMDYKWALPDQMAQAGFYHQPNSAGDDRAMCFTCTVCLVCWERTDEPWSEHERHSPTCPFVMGEYTQNVPLSVTYATNPAVDATYHGINVSCIGSSSSSVPHLVATANSEGLISVFDVSGKVKRTHSFFVTQYDSHLLEKYTQDFGVPVIWTETAEEAKNYTERKITALTIVGEKSTQNTTPPTVFRIRPSVICGLTINTQSNCTENRSSLLNESSMNNQNIKKDTTTNSTNIMEVDDSQDCISANTCLYLVVYDFQYTKHETQEDDMNSMPDGGDTIEELEENINKKMFNAFNDDCTIIDVSPTLHAHSPYLLGAEHAATTPQQAAKFLTSLSSMKTTIGYETYNCKYSLYQNLIPGESDEIYIPPPTPPTTHHQSTLCNKHTGPRILDVQKNTETDSTPVSTGASALILPPDYSFMNGQLSSESSEKSISDHITDLQNNSKSNNYTKKLNYSRAVQCVSFPAHCKHREDLYVSDILPSQDGLYLLVVLKSLCDMKNSLLLLYSLNFSGKMVKINEEPLQYRELTFSEKPLEVGLIPLLDKNTDCVGSGSGGVRTCMEGTVIMVCSDGAVRILELATLKTTAMAKLETEKFVSAVYCNSLERLCASTERGSLHFYALNDSDNDSTEEHDEDDLTSLSATDYPGMSTQPLEYPDGTETTRCFHDPPDLIPLPELKRLHQLCHFEPFKGGYNPVVPPCWSEMQQAQRQRRHPQHLQKEKEQVTKTWRLQTDTTTWDEHIFEITLPTPTNIGHVDVNFTLHGSSSTPRVEVTLLRQNSSSIGHRRDVKFDVDDTISFDQLQSTQNPVTTQEYLRAHNADILAGPIDIASCLDLTDQSGCVTLTSPKLFKSRNRNLLLHIKSVCNKDEAAPVKNVDILKCMIRPKRPLSSAVVGNGTSSTSSSGGGGGSEYMGCDCLHELTVTVFSCTHTELTHERSQRCSMLESRVFVQSLLMTAIEGGVSLQGVAMDILTWIASVRLARNRTGNGEVPPQQHEFITCIEANLAGLMRTCLLKASRSTSHKCLKLLIICTEGAGLMYDQLEKSILSTLLQLLDNINEVKSAGALQWLVVLLYKVSNKNSDLVRQVTSKCVQLLADLAGELTKRNNPYHLILRSRYGLYGTPLEPELFDIEPPSPMKAISTPITYASVVSGENITQSADFHSNYAFNKEQLDPKEVLLNLNESRSKLMNVQPSKLFKGLLETEPLHFACVSASDGTRVERADATTAGVISNLGAGGIMNNAPISITHVANSGTKKVEMEQLFNEYDMLYGAEKAEKVLPSCPILVNICGDQTGQQTGGQSTSASSIVDNMYQVLFNSDNLKNEDYAKLFAEALENNIDSETTSNTTDTTNKSTRCAEDILSPNKSLPWQQLLVTPSQQVIVVERMHSGARRFVTLDFGQPVLLTDLFLPTCVELLSVSIDIWLKGEDIDMQRLVLSTDISTKNLVLSDLQPPPLCRYIKITAVGRYGMSSTRCRIPVGYFYGHLIVLPEEIPAEHSMTLPAPTPAELEKQLNVLSMLFEDVSCRYSLACSKLKNLLQPFLMSDTTNTAHLNAYMDIMKDKNNCTTFDNVKIFNAYQEAITYQRQLNTVRNVMCRIETTLNKTSSSTSNQTLSLASSCTDKLRTIAETILEILLIVDNVPMISTETCEKLFQGYCISQRSHVQFLAATVLDRSCRTKAFWGTFLADSLSNMFRSTYTTKFPQDRVFILLAYLVKRCSERSIALDATLKVIAECLLPLHLNRKPLLGVSVDLCQLGWMLLYLSLQLDLSKGSMQNSTRWDWVTGEMVNRKTSENVNSVYKKKLHKRFLQYKQQLDNIEYNQKAVQNSAQALSALSSQAQSLTEKLEQALKGDGIFSKLKGIKKKEKADNYNYINLISGGGSPPVIKQIGKRRRDTGGPAGVADNTNEKGSQVLEPQYVEPLHTLTVVKGLLTLLLAMDHSSSADLFVLSCKVIARLVKISNLSLDEYMDDDKLLRLINLCIGSDLPFATHALACLLQDVLDVGKTIANSSNITAGTMMTTTSTTATTTTTESDMQAPSTSWTSDILRDVENLCDSFEMEETLMTGGTSPIISGGSLGNEPVVKQGKPSHAPTPTTSSSTGCCYYGNHLPSVFESDDSEIEDFLDEILERGRNILKRGGSNSGISKTSYATNQLTGSTAMDQRLDLGVEALPEVTLRRLALYTTHTLLQNTNAPANAGGSNTSSQEMFQESRVPVWPDALLHHHHPQPPMQQHANRRNSNMLAVCFDTLFKDFEAQNANKIEQILQLWLTLNCQYSDEKFNPSTMPFIPLSVEAINSLISMAAWTSDLSLRTWCSALQTLTLMCNVTQPFNTAAANNSCRYENEDMDELDMYRLFGKTSAIINHKDFVQMMLRLLSGTGIQHCERGLAGPAVCKAMHDLLVRLQMRCNVTNPTSAPGIKFKSYMLKVVYQLVQPSGPFASKLGPLDAQCRLLQTIVNLNYKNADLSIAMSILESTGVLVHSHVANVERIKCVNIGERPTPTSNAFSGIFACVLGGENTKQDKPVSWDVLLIYLLKLLASLVQTPLPASTATGATHHLLIVDEPQQHNNMDTDETESISQTDESKAEQIHQDTTSSRSPSVAIITPIMATIPCLADTALQHHPSIIRLCKALAACKASSLSMLANISASNTFSDLGEPGSVGDAVFNVLAALARKATRKTFIMEPLLLFLTQTPQLSEPLLWFILQVLDSETALHTFVNANGIKIIGESLVKSSNAPNTISSIGNVSMVMQHFIGHNQRTDASAIGVPSNTKKQQQASLENNLNLINFAPQGTICCSSTTAHPAEILIQGGQATHRRARAPQWSYHFYPEEAHADLTLQLPSAILLREVHIQPHQGSLATCPSAVSLEVSADGASRLVPACPPLPTSGMAFIRLHLPAPEVVNCVQIRLYKPRDASNIGLSQIRLLGTSAFGGNTKQQQLDLSEDESHCKYSLGWLRLLHHCLTFTSDEQMVRTIVSNAAHIDDLLETCCGLLIVPTHIPALYLGNLEKILCELSLFNRENGLRAISMLLDSRPNVTEPSVLLNLGSGKLLMNSPGAQSACELLYRICGHQDEDTGHRVSLVLSWLETVARRAISSSNSNITCSPAYISIIASIIWDAKLTGVAYDLSAMVTLDLFNCIYEFNTVSVEHAALKYALDSLLCSLCYVKADYFPLLLQKMAVLIPNHSTDHGASICDDRKDSESMTDDRKRSFAITSEWYERLIIKDMNDLFLSNENLETIALVSRSPTAIQQLLDSRLPKLLNSAILDYCSGVEGTGPMGTLKNVTAILKFFSDISEEKLMRDWLGSVNGSQFWLPLLQFLCKKTVTEKKSTLRSEAHTYLEEVCVKFLSKCCLCHPSNQNLLARVLCEVIVTQNNGISGFLRRLILQLLLENEKIPVSVKADETLYKNSTVLHPYLPLHPAFKQTHDRALLYLPTNTTISEILDNYVSFSTTLKNEPTSASKKDSLTKLEYLKSWCVMAVDSDLSLAAGCTAKDKRLKDSKNIATSTPILKKKRYATTEGGSGIDIMDGRVVKCLVLSEQPLYLGLTLAQVLRMIEEKGVHCDLTCCLHLTVCQSGRGNEDENKQIQVNSMMYQVPLSSTLQVFSSMGGLALLAQHLPTVYPETIRTPQTDKNPAEQAESDWVKVDGNGSDDIYEDIEDGPGSSTPSKVTGSTQNVPPHSLTAFGLFLRLPGYAEVLLRDMKKALCLLRLVLGVTDDGEGVDIFQSPVADSLPTLPFEVLRKLYDATPLSTDDGTLLRRLSISMGVIHLLLACLGIFTHQTQSNPQNKDSKGGKDEKSQLYWAKGTGFGTGSTQQSWNVEQALLKQRSEEEHVTVLLQVLSSYIQPFGDETELSTNVLPAIFEELLSNSALLPALSSYLRNDSVLDMARHIPLYRAALELLRSMAASCQLVTLLLPQGGNKGPSISSLLKNMKTCVDTYASKLRSAQTQKNIEKTNNKLSSSAKFKFKVGEQLECERDEGLAMLMPDIQLTATMVCEATDKLAGSDLDNSRDSHIEGPLSISPEEKYLAIMKTLQFDTYEMIQELPEGGYKFVISHHYESNARAAGDSSHPARVKRLAQEAVTLATSLPLSHSSSVFVRCDGDRLDIMKVLITGPADTPYANGCFEFDVYFPPDYPLAPMMINLETTGHHSVRFNPNLYNDGKVCLSVLNTWHGRPEEKWNAQTSSFLQVLVSIQSLILVSEPYFNEPGYERSRGTPSGTQSSREYNANICQATVRWAMLEQLVNPCPCFKDVIHSHFYLKKQEIMDQCERWIADLESDNIDKRATTTRATNKRNLFTSIDSFKKVYDTFKTMLLKLKAPEGTVSDMEEPLPPPPPLPTAMDVDNGNANVMLVNGYEQSEVDIDMEKMVNDMCE